MVIGDISGVERAVGEFPVSRVAHHISPLDPFSVNVPEIPVWLFAVNVVPCEYPVQGLFDFDLERRHLPFVTWPDGLLHLGAAALEDHANISSEERVSVNRVSNQGVAHEPFFKA